MFEVDKGWKMFLSRDKQADSNDREERSGFRKCYFITFPQGTQKERDVYFVGNFIEGLTLKN